MFKQIIVWPRLNLLARKSPVLTLPLLLSCFPQFAHSTRAQALSYRPTPVQTLGLQPSRPKIAAQSPAVTALVPDQEDVGRVLNNLAVAYSTLGKYDKAEAAILRAIAISEKTIGPDNVRLADQLESLADIYVIKEEYAKAEPLYRRALKIQEKALPADHPASAVNLMGLARLHYYQGEYAKAEPLFQRALAIREKALGPDHPDVAETLNAVARL